MTKWSFTSAFPLALEALDTSAPLCISIEDPEAISMLQQIPSLTLEAPVTMLDPLTANTSYQ